MSGSGSVSGRGPRRPRRGGPGVGPGGRWRAQVTPFQREVYDAILGIPRGQVRTYAEVARMIGRPRAARAVGQALRRNRWAPAIPCHRVVAAGRGARGARRRAGVLPSGLELGGYSGPGGLRRKRRLLELEETAARRRV